MVKSKSLQEVVHEAAAPPPRTARTATRGVILRLPAEMHRELRQLAINEETSLQALGMEALQQLLKQRRR